jgi:hypothetical protein
MCHYSSHVVDAATILQAGTPVPSTILVESELQNTQTLKLTQQARQHIRYILIMLLYNNTCMPILRVHTHPVEL